MKVLDLQWSHDSAFIVSASADTTCVIWDASKGNSSDYRLSKVISNYSLGWVVCHTHTHQARCTKS